jgi:hypothetical protein
MSETFLGVVNVVVTDRSVTSNPVVPDAHGTIVPLDTDLQVGRDGDVLETSVSVCDLEPILRAYLEQELEKRIGLFVFQAYDAACKAWIDVQSFLAGCLTSISLDPKQRAYKEISWRKDLLDARGLSGGYSSLALCERIYRPVSRSQLA